MNYQKGFIVPLLLIIIAILVVGGGTYVFTQNKSVDQPVGVTQTADAPSITVTSPSGGEMYTKSIPVRWTSKNIQGNVSIQAFLASRLLFTVSPVSNTGSKDINLADYYGAGDHAANGVSIKICDNNNVCGMGVQAFSFRVTIATSTQETPISIAFPPSGWYVHNFDTSIMLTKQKTLPNCQGTEGACYGEQIDIHSSSITLTPEQYVAKIIQDGVFPSVQKWDTLNGHKTFSMTYTTEANDVPIDGQYLFVGNTAYQFALYPSAEKDRADLQQVVKYYATR